MVQLLEVSLFSKQIKHSPFRFKIYCLQLIFVCLEHRHGGCCLNYRIRKPSFFRCLFVKNYLNHTRNKHSLFTYLHVFQKKIRLLTRSALWLLFHVLKRETFGTNLIVQYQNFVQSTVLFQEAVFPLLMA